MKKQLLTFLVIITLNNFNQVIDAQSLLADYEFSGNCNDTSIYQVNGVSYGAYFTNDRWGNANSAIHFTGDLNPPYSYVQTLDVTNHEPVNNFSVTVWAKYTDNNYLIMFPHIFSKRNDDYYQPYTSYGIFLDNQNGLQKWLATISTSNISDAKLYSLNQVQLNQWSNFAMTFGSDSLKFYIDGKLQGTKYVNGNILYSAIGLRIGTGRPNAGNVSFTGDVDELKIYNKVLSPQEINQIYSGINDIQLSQSNRASLFPNPFHNSTTIEISDSRFTKGELNIYDIIGQKVYYQTIISKKENLNLNLSNGTYFYKINNDTKEIIGYGKLIIQ
ncbi:MAG: T9SS type A sorting domain-containing protein [Bacteroidetes bacterium]|nr:T9SS type A sorting domain-containing protein [Bacteroidota bacterium]